MGRFHTISTRSPSPFHTGALLCDVVKANEVLAPAVIVSELTGTVLGGGEGFGRQVAGLCVPSGGLDA